MGIDLNKVKEQFEKDEGFWFVYPNDEEVKIKIKPLPLQITQNDS